jgi:hypothetical protein
LLNDFDVRDKYIKTIIAENLVELLEHDLEYIEYLIDNQNQLSGTFESRLERKIRSFNNTKLISDQFSDNSDDFNGLFALKKKSLSDPNDISVINFNEIINSFKIDLDDINQINDLKSLINEICNICDNIQNDNVTISWIQLAKLLFVYDNKPKLKAILQAYYSELDLIYERIITRIQMHNKRVNSTSDDYYRYMNRVNEKKRANIEIIQENNNLKQLVNQLTNTNLYTIHALPQMEAPIVVENIKRELTLADTPDLIKIANTDIKMRVESINQQFIILTSEPVEDVGSEIDPDEVD